MTSRRPFRRSTLFAAALALGAASRRLARPRRPLRRYRQGARRARSTRLKVNFKAANIVYLTHPLAKELSVGCRGDKYSIELYAKGDRKPKPEFFSLVGAMARDRVHRAEGRQLDRLLALPQAHGTVARRQGRDALPPAQHGMHPHQDRGGDRHHARQGRIAAAPPGLLTSAIGTGSAAACLPESGAILRAAFREPRMIAKLLLQNLLYVAGMGALLFAFAGTLHWPAAWIFLGTMSCSASPAARGLPEEIRPCSPSA